MIYRTGNKKLYPKAQNYMTLTQEGKHNQRSKFLRNQTVEAKNPMNSFLNDSFKQSAEINRATQMTNHSLINIEDDQVRLNLSTAESKKIRSISNKRQTVKEKLPSLQQGSIKGISHNNIGRKVYSTLARRENHNTQPNIIPTNKQSILRTRFKQSSVPKNVYRTTNKFEGSDKKLPMAVRPQKQFEIKKGIRRVNIKPGTKIAHIKAKLDNSKASNKNIEILNSKIEEKSEEYYNQSRTNTKRKNEKYHSKKVSVANAASLVNVPKEEPCTPPLKTKEETSHINIQTPDLMSSERDDYNQSLFDDNNAQNEKLKYEDKKSSNSHEEYDEDEFIESVHKNSPKSIPNESKTKLPKVNECVKCELKSLESKKSPKSDICHREIATWELNQADANNPSSKESNVNK